MAGVFTTPCRPKVAEDIRDLQGRPGHGRALHQQVQILQWAFDLSQQIRRDMAVASCIFQPMSRST